MPQLEGWSYSRKRAAKRAEHNLLVEAATAHLDGGEVGVGVRVRVGVSRAQPPR